MTASISDNIPSRILSIDNQWFTQILRVISNVKNLILKPLESKPDIDLRRYVVITPKMPSPGGRTISKKERQNLYEKAKLIVQAMPESFKSRGRFQ